MTRKINNFICVMLAVCIHIVCTIQGERCEQLTYLSPSGLTCFYCIPGTYKVEDCKTNYTGALCTKCPKNTYQRNCNRAESCEPCSLQCKARSKKLQNCTLYANIICECQEGHYLFQEPSTDGVCVQHKPCEVGYGMVNPGNPYNDTECKECDNGTFSNTTTFDRCRLCRKCDNYKTLCTTKKDAECQDAYGPTQTTERYNSSTVHSSTAHMPKQTTEWSDGFKGQFDFLVVLNSLILSILLILLICVFICVLIYVSGKCKRVQELWRNCSHCSNCSKGPPDHQRRGTPTQEQHGASDKISQEQGNPSENTEQGNPPERPSSTSGNMVNSVTNDKEDQDSFPQMNEKDPLMMGEKAKQSNVNGTPMERVVSIFGAKVQSSHSGSYLKSEADLTCNLPDEKNSSEMKHFKGN